MEVDTGHLVAALTTVYRSLDATLKEAKGHFEESQEDFVDSKYSCLARMIDVYVQGFNSLGVTTRKDLDDICKQQFRNSEVRECFEELTGQEEMWSSFLETVDGSILPDHPEMERFIGDRGPVNVMVTDARTGEPLRVGDGLGTRKLVLILLRKFA